MVGGGLPVKGVIIDGALEVNEHAQQIDLHKLFFLPNHFLFSVTDDSLSYAGLCVGDLIVCERINEYKPSDIVIMIINGMFKIKKLVSLGKERIEVCDYRGQRLEKLDRSSIHVMGGYKGLVRLGATQHQAAFN